MHLLEIAGVQYVSTAKVMAAAGISRQTLWRWRREGRIPQGHRFRTGRLLFTDDEYREILAHANRVEPEAFAGAPRDGIDASPGGHG